MSVNVTSSVWPGCSSLPAVVWTYLASCCTQSPRSASKRLLLWRISVNCAGSVQVTWTGPSAWSARGACGSVTVRGAAEALPTNSRPARAPAIRDVRFMTTPGSRSQVGSGAQCDPDPGGPQCRRVCSASAVGANSPSPPPNPRRLTLRIRALADPVLLCFASCLIEALAQPAHFDVGTRLFPGFIAGSGPVSHGT